MAGDVGADACSMSHRPSGGGGCAGDEQRAAQGYLEAGQDWDEAPQQENRHGCDEELANRVLEAEEGATHEELQERVEMHSDRASSSDPEEVAGSVRLGEDGDWETSPTGAAELAAGEPAQEGDPAPVSYASDEVRLALQALVDEELTDLVKARTERRYPDQFGGGPEEDVSVQFLADAHRAAYFVDEVEFLYTSVNASRAGHVEGVDDTQDAAAFAETLAAAVKQCLAVGDGRPGSVALMRLATLLLSQAGMALVDLVCTSPRLALSGGERSIQYALRRLPDTASRPRWEITTSFAARGFGEFVEAGASDVLERCSTSSFLRRGCSIHLELCSDARGEGDESAGPEAADDVGGGAAHRDVRISVAEVVDEVGIFRMTRSEDASPQSSGGFSVEESSPAATALTAVQRSPASSASPKGEDPDDTWSFVPGLSNIVPGYTYLIADQDEQVGEVRRESGRARYVTRCASARRSRGSLLPRWRSGEDVVGSVVGSASGEGLRDVFAWEGETLLLSPAPQEEDVVSAWYGHPTDPARRVDITADVRELVRHAASASGSDKEVAIASTNRWGDPAFLVWKALTVTLRKPEGGGCDDAVAPLQGVGSFIDAIAPLQ